MININKEILSGLLEESMHKILSNCLGKDFNCEDQHVKRYIKQIIKEVVKSEEGLYLIHCKEVFKNEYLF